MEVFFVIMKIMSIFANRNKSKRYCLIAKQTKNEKAQFQRRTIYSAT